MASNAVILSVTVILSLFLLSHARLDSAAIQDDEIATSTPLRDPQSAEEKDKSNSIEIEKETMAVDLSRPVYLNSDQIAHSFRLPSGGRRHVARPLKPALEISYGNDMVWLQKKDGKKQKKRKDRHRHDSDSDSDSDSDEEDEEMEQQEKLKKRLRKTMKKKLKMERESGNNGGFANWIWRFLNRF